jgi:type II secretory pathway pseudopilin PulG
MMNKIKFQIRNFTIVELLMVVSIIAVLFSILTPSLSNSRKRAKYTRWMTFCNNLKADSSLIAQYTFEDTAYIRYNETANDTLPNTAMGFSIENYDPRKLNGEVYGCAKTNHGRWPNKGAMYFPGNGNNYVSICDETMLNPGTGSFTVLFWVKITDKKKCYLLCKGNAKGKRPGWNINKNNKNQIICSIAGLQSPTGKSKKPKKVKYTVTSKVVPLSSWIQVAMVIDQDNFYLISYINGSEAASDKIKDSFDIVAKETFTLIGRNALVGSPFKGYIDEIEIFGRALTAGEIMQAYEMGKP